MAAMSRAWFSTAASAPVAADPAPVRGLAPWRKWSASLLLALFALAGLWRALQEPSLGWRFEMAEDGRIRGVPVHSARAPLADLRSVGSGAGAVALDAELMVEAPGLLDRYADQDRFHASHRALWQLLQQPSVALHSGDGRIEVRPEPKTLGQLGAPFWVAWLLGLLSLSVGLAVWVYRPRDRAAFWYASASVAYAYIMLITACSSSRLLTQEPEGWSALHQLAHGAGFLQIAALCLLLCQHPTRLAMPWLPAALLLWSGGWLVVDIGRLLPSIALAYRLPSVLLTLGMLAIFALQWRACRADPIRRAQLKWFGLLLLVSWAVVFVGFSFGAMQRSIELPMVYGLGWLSLFFLGLIPLVTRIGLFQLERWWAHAWLWFLGGLLVVLLDLVVLAWLPDSSGNALVLAMALGGWLYFPLRQLLWRRLSKGALPDTRDVLPDVVELVTSGQTDPAALRERWRGLWDKVFLPQSIRNCDPLTRVLVQEDGQALAIPGYFGLPGLRLGLPERGHRLYNEHDLRRADELVRLVQHGLASHEAFERGAREERQRIASDLHDDLGARLLGIVQGSDSRSIADLARQALDEMRLSVRGLSADACAVADALADWRAETVQRLDAAGFEVSWSATQVRPDQMLASRTRVQLTRILREAVGNAIAHSAGHVCHIKIAFGRHDITLDVMDDGRGMVAAGLANGHGLPNIERRVRKLGGRHSFGRSKLGGVWLMLSIPVDSSHVAPQLP